MTPYRVWCYKKGLLGNFLERGVQYAVGKVSTFLTETIKNWQMFTKFAPYLLNIKLKSDGLIPWFPTRPQQDTPRIMTLNHSIAILQPTRLSIVTTMRQVGCGVLSWNVSILPSTLREVTYQHWTYSTFKVCTWSKYGWFVHGMQLQARLAFQDGAERGSLMQLSKTRKRGKRKKLQCWEGGKLYNTCCFPLISVATPLRYPLNHSESLLVDSQWTHHHPVAEAYGSLT